MRKFLIAALAATALVPAVASAQSAREVRQDNREVRRDKQEVQRHLRNGDYENARKAQQELREDRREMREDWRDYRTSHSEVFRRGAWHAPRGYSYRPVRAGTRFQPVYYSSRYWVNDYATYRLPQPGYGQRWVRYGNDVVLVNTSNGRIVQVLTRFFL